MNGLMTCLGTLLRGTMLAAPLALTAGWNGAAEAGPLGDVTVATHLDVTTLNSSKNSTGWHRWIYRNMNDPLVTLGRDGEIKGGLAESWERIDDTTVRFHLRKNVTFHNGEKLTAEAVLLGLNEGKTPDAQSKGTLSLVKEGRVVDEHTIDLITDGPVAYLVDTLTDRLFALPPEYYAKVGNEGFATAPVGTGPYKFVSWARGDKIIFEAFDGYWDGEPKADKLTFWIVPDASARAAAVLNGEATIATAIAPLEAPRFEASQDARIEATATGNRPVWAGMMMNRPVFQDIRVREAVNLAINRQAIVDRLLRGYGKPMGQMCASSMYCYDPAIEAMPYDLERAKALMAEAAPADTNIVLHAPQGPVAQINELTQVVKSSLEAIGFTVELRIDEASQFSKKLYDWDNQNKDVGDIFIYFYQGGPGSETAIRSLSHPKGNWNWQFWHNAEAEELWTKATATFDEAERQQMLRDLSGLVRKEIPWLFLYEPLSVWAIDRDVAWTARDDDQLIIQEMELAAQ